ncbi:TIGR03619 family F420-dependent LLM class oxidoreductase [Streptomyces sp. NPDC050560]|uniref:TIGR03619 family F420-dependent LLM class oxidoreductase n=1 Tax=Streptomyces sp. NPDC050560 TaxID=3365630 RepID=UPI00379E6580
MQIGFTLPQFGAVAAEPGAVARFARAAEELGAHSLWVGDRLLAPVRPVVGYAGGPGVPEEFNSSLDPFALLAVAAAVTARPLLGTSVLNAPWYPPAVLGRQLTTLDAVSGGRLLPGFGIGWSPDEYEAVGVPMRDRGARLDECLDALGALWSDGTAEHHGTYWSIPESHMGPRTVARPRPPFYLGGYSAAALARVARRADGWLPVARPGGAPFDPESVNGPLAAIHRVAREAGRDPADIDVVLRLNPTAGTGPEDTARTLTAADAGTPVTHAFVDLMYVAGTVDESLAYAAEVLRHTGAATPPPSR